MTRWLTIPMPAVDAPGAALCTTGYTGLDESYFKHPWWLDAGYDGLEFVAQGPSGAKRTLWPGPIGASDVPNAPMRLDMSLIVNHTAGALRFVNFRFMGGRDTVMTLGQNSRGTNEQRPLRMEFEDCVYDSNGKGIQSQHKYQVASSYVRCVFKGMGARTQHGLDYDHGIASPGALYTDCFMEESGAEGKKDVTRPNIEAWNYYGKTPPNAAHALAGTPWYPDVRISLLNTQIRNWGQQSGKWGGGQVYQGPAAEMIRNMDCILISPCNADGTVGEGPAFAHDLGGSEVMGKGEYYNWRTGAVQDGFTTGEIHLENSIYHVGTIRSIIRIFGAENVTIRNCAIVGPLGAWIRIGTVDSLHISGCNTPELLEYARYQGVPDHDLFSPRIQGVVTLPDIAGEVVNWKAA